MNVESSTLNPHATWRLPPSLRKRREDVEIRFRFTRAERKVYRKRKPIRPSQWAERHRPITRGPYKGTIWKNSRAPYLPGIMDAAALPYVRTIIVCAAPQTGKSAAVDTFAGYRVDRAPGPALYIYPDESTCDENMKDRIIPMIRQSRRLSGYMTGTADDASSKRITLLHMEISMGWARSASKLGNKTIQDLYFDECDKFPRFAGLTEADPFSLGEARTTWYRWTKKVWKVSTPTVEAGPIWQALTKEAAVRFDFEVWCPACGQRQVMEWGQFKWPDPSPAPEEMEARHLAEYECRTCRTRWNDQVRDMACSKGRWISRAEDDPETGRKVEGGIELFAYCDKYRPEKIGFQVPSWISWMVSLSQAAADFLRGKYDKGKLRHWANAHCAQPWLEYAVERKEDRILLLRDTRPASLVPSGGVVSVITAGVDTQDMGFWYEIRAHGWGREQETWQIREGFILEWEALDRILWEDEYMDANGLKYFIRLVVQDAFGVKARTPQVYDYSRMHRGRHFPYKGEQQMQQPLKWGKIDTYPGTNKPIPGGIQLVHADTTYYKNLLAAKLEIGPKDPGAWHLHAETTEAYARHMCAEYRDPDTQIWQCRSGQPNHLWDCGVMNLVAADILGVKFWKRPEERQVQGSRSKVQGEDREENREGGRIPYERPAWLNR